MANSAVQFLRLPMLASSGLAVVASGLLYFKQKFVRLYRSLDTTGHGACG